MERVHILCIRNPAQRSSHHVEVLVFGRKSLEVMIANYLSDDVDGELCGFFFHAKDIVSLRMLVQNPHEAFGTLGDGRDLNR